MAAAHEANTNGSRVVFSEAHHYRWQYPHTLGRMRAYGEARERQGQGVTSKDGV